MVIIKINTSIMSEYDSLEEERKVLLAQLKSLVDQIPKNPIIAGDYSAVDMDSIESINSNLEAINKSREVDSEILEVLEKLKENAEKRKQIILGPSQN